MFKGKARAYTNIALIKYWGKKNEALILPMNNSLSLTLDAFYTETEVIFSDSYIADEFYLDDTLQDEKATKKVSQFLDLFRKEAGISLKASVISQNFVPTAAGLASSASGLAALAGACNTALKLGLDDLSLSRFSRRGSGSACRSIFGGFVEWEKGHDDLSSYAKPVPSDSFEDELAMVFILINDQKKEVSSRNGMRRTVETSSFYQGWLDSVEGDLYQLKQAIKTKDFQLLGETMERNGLKRSIFGGFVEWEKGHDDLSSYAKPVPSDSFEDDLAMVFILINDQKKEVYSINGMRRTVETSSFYQGWLDSGEGDLYQLKQAITTKDFQLLVETMERKGLKMHVTTLAAQPPFTYWSPDSLIAMYAVRQF